jgi:hypothetical protein
MELLDYCAHVAVVWLVASTIAAGAWSIAVTRYKRRAQANAEYVNWIPFLPPVPTQADIDATWLSAWPSAVDDDELMHREFESIVSAEWHWPVGGEA